MSLFVLDAVSAVPSRKRNYEEDVAPLDDGLINQYIVKCDNGGEVTMNETILRKIPYLMTIIEVDTTTVSFTIPNDRGCNQETLDMVNAFMSGDNNVWNSITASNAEDLTLMADFLGLSDLMNQCIVWILKGIYLDGFQISEKLQNSEHYDEIQNLLKFDISDIKFEEPWYLSVIIQGNELFKKFENVTRFSGLKVIVKESITLTSHDCSKLMIHSLELDNHDQSNFAFLANGIYFPELKRLSLKNAKISDLSSLSDALNNVKMPKLEFLDLSENEDIILDHFYLTRTIDLKYLNLEMCDLIEIDRLADLLYQMPKLEELNLSGNEQIKLETLSLSKPIKSLKRLNLGSCRLDNLSPLSSILAEMSELEKLDLSWNRDIELSAFQFNPKLRYLSLSGCSLEDVSFLQNALAEMTELEVLDLSWNPEIFLDNFRLSADIPLKRLDLRNCELNKSSLVKLLRENIPQVQEVNLSENESIRLNVLKSPTKRLKLA